MEEDQCAHFESGPQEVSHVSNHIFRTFFSHHENQARTRLDCWKLRNYHGVEMSQLIQPYM